ncbi:DNA repair protein RecO [Devriesea agamarum]|uniref:DNA repair protein RecO n=1 Tax=Devriesea agamarum TaxID=472569 RepID=UPI00071E3556|nr:DNA repair protein RecO [Devriesea agamarum]
MSKLFRDHAIILRTHKLGEADRIITLLTRRHGKVRAVAKGVRRTGSRFGSRLEPFGLVDIQFHRGRSLHTVTQVETISPFAADIVTDYTRYTSASVMVETTDRLVGDVAEPSEAHFLLLVGALRTLCAGKIAPALVLDAFLLRSLGYAGWAPNLRSCASCGAPGPHHAFDVAAGGLVCRSCRQAGAVAVREQAVTHLACLMAGQWEPVCAADDTVALEASRLIANSMQWHLERALRSLSYIER